MEHILTRELIVNKKACSVIGILAFVLMIAYSAYARIPLAFTPVPLTLQTLFVLLSAAFMGARRSGLVQVLYVALGSAGMPLFAGGSYGLSYILGPTGGYLAGFLLAAVFVGTLLPRVACGISVAAVFTAGSMLILLCGSAWLYAGYGFSLSGAFMSGFLPFIPGDILKVVAATMLYRKLAPRSRQIFT